MKRLLLASLLCWLLPAAARGQGAYLHYLPSYLDKAKVNFYKDSLQRRAVRPPFFTFLTSERGQPVTYFMWLRGDLLSAIKLTDSTVSRPLTGQPQRFNRLLSMPKLAIRQAEDRLKFRPPVNPLTTDLLFVDAGARTYLVAYGNGAGYVVNPAQNAARHYFFQVLRQDVAALAAHWQPAGRYTRRYE
jgi:hypothetical protein